MSPISAADLRTLFSILHNLDAYDLASAGVTVSADAVGGSDWTRFNNDIGVFVLKLPPDRLEKLAALIQYKNKE
jgi:hypothetical protein